MNPSDRDLISRAILEDDRAAFGELVSRHQSAVRGFLRQRTNGDAATADDLAQETFLQAHRLDPADMNTQPPDHFTTSGDPVERLLREQSSRSSPIPDDGFTVRVLHALPQPKAHRSAPLAFLRAVLLFFGALTGLLLAWSQTPATDGIAAPALWQDLSSATVTHINEVLEWLSAPSQLVTLVSVAATFAAIYLLEDRSQDSQ